MDPGSPKVLQSSGHPRCLRDVTASYSEERGPFRPEFATYGHLMARDLRSTKLVHHPLVICSHLPLGNLGGGPTELCLGGWPRQPPCPIVDVAVLLSARSPNASLVSGLGGLGWLPIVPIGTDAQWDKADNEGLRPKLTQRVLAEGVNSEHCHCG